jgi:hypothetical protein
MLPLSATPVAMVPFMLLCLTFLWAERIPPWPRSLAKMLLVLWVVAVLASIAICVVVSVKFGDGPIQLSGYVSVGESDLGG